jgi:hypothetical protein
VANNEVGGDKKIMPNAGNFDGHADMAVQCGEHPPDGAHLWLHAKPLDAAMGRVPVPYCPGSRHGRHFRMKQKNTNKTQLLPSFHTVDQRKKAKQFRDPKRTLSSRH